MKVDRAHLTGYLSRNAVDKYYIEYKEFLSNHLSHAAVALYKLGDDKKHFDEYLDHYKLKLETPNGRARTLQDIDPSKEVQESVGDLLGKRKGYYKLLAHYRALLEGPDHKGSFASLLRAEFPRLCRGVIGSAFHPVIHIGYGCSVGSADLVVEGLAYLHHSNAPPTITHEDKALLSDFGSGNAGIDLIDMCEDLTSDSDFMSRFKSRAAELHSLEDGVRRLMFDCKAQAALDLGDDLMKRILKVRVPSDAVSMGHWVVEQAVRNYVASEVENDFFLLHGITCSWAMKQVLPLLDEKDRKAACAYMINALIAIYLVQGPHKFDRNRLKGDKSDRSWEEIVSGPITKGHEEVDEHILKLMQVCIDQNEESGGASEGLYKKASRIVQSKFFFFRDTEDGKADAEIIAGLH